MASQNMGTINAKLELIIKNFTDNAESARDTLKSNAEKISSALENLKETASNNFEAISEASLLIGGGMATAGGIVSGALLEMTNKFNENKQTMAKFSAQTGKSGKELEGFEDSIKNTYLNGYGESLEEVTQAYSDYSRELNLSAKETQKLTNKSFQLKDIYDYEINDTLRASSSLMKNLNIDGTEAMDFIAKASQVAGDRASDLLDTIDEYSPRFAEAGLDAEQMFNMLVKGVQSGARNYDVIGDAIKEANILLTEGGDSGQEALTKIFKSGTKAKDMMKKVASGSLETGDAMVEIIDGISKMSNKTDQASAGTAIFGTLWEEVGLKGLQSIFSNKDALGDYNGTLDEANKKMQEQGKTMEQVKREFEQAYTIIGEKLAPILSELLEIISKVINKFIDFATANPIITSIISILGIVISVLGTIAGLIILIAPYVGTITAGFSALAGVISTVGAVAGAVLAGLLSWPVLIIAGIVALVALIILKWDEIKAFTIKAWGAIVDFMKSIPDILKTLWTNFLIWISEKWVEFKENTSNTWNSILDFIKSIPSKLYNFFTSTLPKFVGYVAGTFARMLIDMYFEAEKFFTKTLPNTVKAGWEFLKRLFTQYIPQLIQKIGQFVVDSYKKFQTMKSQTSQKAKEILTGIMNYIKQIPQKLGNLISTTKSKATTLGREMWNGLKSQIKNLPKNVKNIVLDAIKGIGSLGTKAYSALKSIGSNMWDGFKKGLGINSPSYLEKAMFNINDAGFEMMDDLRRNFRTLSSLPQVPALAKVANQSNVNNSTVKNNYTMPITINGNVANGEGVKIGTTIYDLINRNKRYSGVGGE